VGGEVGEGGRERCVYIPHLPPDRLASPASVSEVRRAAGIVVCVLRRLMMVYSGGGGGGGGGGGQICM